MSLKLGTQTYPQILQVQSLSKLILHRRAYLPAEVCVLVCDDPEYMRKFLTPLVILTFLWCKLISVREHFN